MRCGVLEAGHLLVLRREVHDRVRDHVGDGEPALDSGRGEVADCHVNLLRTRFRTQPRDHRLGKVDPVNAYTTLRERQGDPAGADAELERRTAAGEIGKERHDRVDHSGVGQVRVPLVEALRNALAEVILGHQCILSRSTRVACASAQDRHPSGTTPARACALQIAYQLPSLLPRTAAV